MKQIILILAAAFCLASCNDWLDVRPDTEQKDYDQFSTVSGFFDALTGCYMTMADDNAYGQRLTMTNIESLANLWAVSDDMTRLADKELAAHDYTKDNARDAIAAMYDKLFNVIAQANMIIRYADEQGDAFPEESMRKVVQGEAYAIRAYCQLDVLRLFGQMPKGSQTAVSLPYSFTTSIYEMPAYYAFDDYVELLKKDIASALELLKDNDPLFEYTFTELNGSVNVADDHLLYRQSRLNYYAVKALEARMLLYLGDKTGAYAAAKAVIDAKDKNGNPVMKMSGANDVANRRMAYPNECLFYISKFDLLDNAKKILIGGEKDSYSNSHLAISKAMYDELYVDIPVDYRGNRYSSCWGDSKTSMGNNPYKTVLKYWWDDEAVNNKAVYFQIIPMLRMSEVYLIAIETTTSLAEANALFKTYMEEHAVSPILVNDFASLEEVQAYVPNEYRREFYAEGHMFYTYKRLGAASIRWYKDPAGEKVYVLPLPETEYNPNL
ncbi:MAG: RagB/SusD family nutrient uptake outer membrane protein [Odoribacter sp.]|nr:RagB/SusD family nutrient uptake outer membrane protein [Odoribacter sp.]